jgi:two-component system, OmpR family, phosphate regulon sensor histidine kinase PhoR
VWNKFKIPPYLQEFLLYTIAVILLVMLAVPGSLNIVVSVSVISLSIILYVFVLQKRNLEIRSIGDVIRKIRLNQYQSPEELNLRMNLSELEEEIKLMLEKSGKDIEYLKKLEKIRTEFIANVSHELKTPIFTIQGYLETLLDGAIKDDNVNILFLQKASRHTKNLSELVNDLIDISMIESGEMKISPRYFNVTTFISDVVKDLVPLAEAKGLELTCRSARENLTLYGDKGRLKHVLNNLVLNAIKYTDKGKIQVIAEEDGKLIVRDTGIGIPETELNRIFERFYRIDKARSKEVGGTGLGLSIVKHLVEAHGSKIEVKSTPGEGSEFFFKLKK